MRAEGAADGVGEKGPAVPWPCLCRGEALTLMHSSSTPRPAPPASPRWRCTRRANGDLKQQGGKTEERGSGSPPLNQQRGTRA